MDRLQMIVKSFPVNDVNFHKIYHFKQIQEICNFKGKELLSIQKIRIINVDFFTMGNIVIMDFIRDFEDLYQLGQMCKIMIY